MDGVEFSMLLFSLTIIQYMSSCIINIRSLFDRARGPALLVRKLVFVQEAALAALNVPFFHATEAVYFMLALVVVSVETGTPLIPFSPGWLLPLSIPTLVTPESEATGASPGALDSVWPGALATPSPWTVVFRQFV
jgi:hypothetical protein